MHTCLTRKNKTGQDYVACLITTSGPPYRKQVNAATVRNIPRHHRHIQNWGKGIKVKNRRAMLKKVTLIPHVLGFETTTTKKINF